MEKKPESIFINRELSWLDFDSRVLALAKEKTVPLGERIKFAAIFGSNMDEFFMVRVGSLYDQTLLKTNKTDNVTHMTAAEQINAITPRVAELQAKCDKYFQHLVSALAEQGYHKVDFTKLSKQQEHFWKTYFQRELLPLLSPQIVDSRHPFPFLNNKDIYYIAQLHSKNEGVSYGIVPVSNQFERVLFVKDGETACFAFVEELIAHYAATIFTASTVQKQCLFRVTRNADITVDEDAIPVKDAVLGACEMLGYDVMQVANEGKMVCVVAADEAEAALAAMRKSPYGADAAIIGRVTEADPARGPKVFLRTAFGSTRILDMLVGEQLPRIC